MMPTIKEISSGSILDDIEHHFRIFAGPGAGKTYWLVRHIRNVQHHSRRLCGINRIGCISYTNVAAQQIIKGLDNNAERVEVSTIHSFLYKYVVKPYLHLLKDDGGDNLVNYALVSGHDEHRPSYGKLQEWLNLIGNRKLLRFHSIFLPALKNLQWRLDYDNDDLSLILRGRIDYFPTSKLSLYKPIFWKDGIIDHEDVLYFAYRILKEFPTLRPFLSALYPYIFLDEFQDTNPIQTQIVKWLAEESTVVGVIGDSKQSIYGFQGAKPEDFKGLDLPGQIDYRIADNRRSTRKIVEFINSVRNDNITQDALRGKLGDVVKVIVGDKEPVVKYLEQFHDPDNFAVLTRKNIDVASIRNLDGKSKFSSWDDFYSVDNDRALFIDCFVAAGELARRGNFDLALKTMIKGIKMRSIV